MDIEREKQAAARAALAFIKDGYVVGLGTGTTSSYFIGFLGERVRAGLKVRCIPSSDRTRDIAEGFGIPVTGFGECPEIDVTVDGADEISPALELIKGHGGALLREKIVASASRKVVIIADSGKLVKTLGRFPLPVEVVPFAQALMARRIAALGADVIVRTGEDGLPFVTDEGHHILDCAFGRITDPATLAHALNSMPGVQEHGLFLDLADIALIGKGEEVMELRRNAMKKKGRP